MIFYIIKKAIPIYTLISSFLIFIFATLSLASDDVKTYCFPPNESVLNVNETISFLNNGNDRIQIRRIDNCLDIQSSDLRIGLYEKMIFRNFHPIEKKSEEVSDLTAEHCRLEFSEIKKVNTSESKLLVGEKNILGTNDNSRNESTKTELLMLPKRKSSITVGKNTLNLECVKLGNDTFEIIFSLSEKVQSSTTGRKGSTIDLGSIVKELNDKKTNLGIPQTEIKNVEGFEQTKYELKIL